MTLHPINRLAPILALMATLMAGCDTGNLGRVEGTITLDGQPLTNANIEFFPNDGGGASAGTTDQAGHYELHYGREAMGAVVGDHLVKIYTAGVGSTEGDYGASTPEKLPAKYNVHSELTETVAAGANIIDFELDSNGKIIQPPGMRGGRY